LSDIVCADSVCQDRLERILLTNGNLLERCGVENELNPFNGAGKSGTVADVADCETDIAGAFEGISKFNLPGLIAAQNTHESGSVTKK
jgi:hypothetical protein